MAPSINLYSGSPVSGLGELLSRGFYIFPIRANAKAPPLVRFKQAATNDPKTISDWVTKFPGCNFGIFTGKFGVGEALLVLDIDKRPGKDGFHALARLELENGDLPATFEVATPSGGRHIYFRVVKAVKQGANVLGKGVDIRSRGGYVLGPGSQIFGKKYRICAGDEIACAPLWLSRLCGSDVRLDDAARVAPEMGSQRSPDNPRVRRFLRENAPPGKEGSRNETGYRVACRLKDLGVPRTECADFMAEHWACEPPLDLDELRHVANSAYKYGIEPPGVATSEADFSPVAVVDDLGTPFEQLNREFAFVIAGGGAHILWETTDARQDAIIEHLSMPAFHGKFASHKMQSGEKTVNVTREWMSWKGRRSYDGFMFAPEQPTADRFYNLWRGFAVEPWPAKEIPPQDAQEAVDAFLEHARENVCRGDERLYQWLIGYFAHLVQKPWEKPLVALVFRGGKGVGKNALIERIGDLLGSHFLLTSNRRYLIGNFNGHLENCLLFALDEAFWSGDKQAEGTLKDLITGKRHVIEHKGKEPYSVENRTRVAIIGNEDWIVPASHDERRFAVFDVGDGRKQNRNFFRKMREGLEHDGSRVLLAFLKTRSLAGFDPNAAPLTPALLEQKYATLEPTQQWWLACLQDGRLVASDFSDAWPEKVECERFKEAVHRYVKERNIRSRLPDVRYIGRQIKKVCPSLDHMRIRTGTSTPWVYRLPSLETARAEWSKFIGQTTEWDA